MRYLLIAVIAVAALGQNPSSFPCDEHVGRTFIKQNSIYPDGRCWDVYSHPSPTHRVRVLCQ